MNKNRYRVVYNKARQIFMAVAENVKSQTKNSGQSTASSTVEEQSQPFHQLWQVKCLVASMSLWMPLAPVYAQIQADNSANAGNRPVIGVGQNSQGQNVPVVNIQTPTNGVSHNIYKQMDVLPEGVVLNNSRTGANSALVGTVGANPFLAQGEARIILNEVNSNVASRFEGNLEVAGQRADVIIANPAGINIQGGGFINANKAILTTGKPQLNADGSIQQFIVDQGKITVSAKSGSSLGLGGNNNNADYVDVYARALELNAQLYANKDIQAITGANNISADLQQLSNRTGTGTTPTLAIDVKNLGGMYANNIYLLGNEKGLGVSNAGTIRAINNLVVTSAGKIEHTGSLESTSNTLGLVSIQTTQTGDNGNINSSGSISSKSMLSIDAANHLNITGNQVIVNQGVVSPLLLSAKGDINVSNAAKIKNFNSGGDIYLDAKNINLAENTDIGSNGQTNLNSSGKIDAKKGSKITSISSLNLSAKEAITLTDTSLVALRNTDGNINLQSSSSTENQGNITLQSVSLQAGKDLNLYGTGNVILSSLNFTLLNGSSTLQNINAYSGMNLVWDQTAKALPQISGNVTIEAANLIDLKGSNLSTKGDLKLQGKALNLGADLNAGKNLNLTATQSDLILNKTLNAQGNIDVNALAGSITTNSLKANSMAGKISILANKDLTVNSLQDINGAYIYDQKTTIKTSISGNQGVNIGSIGEGKISVYAADLKSDQGDIQLIGRNGVNLLGNTDVSVRNDDSGTEYIVQNTLDAKNILIKNSKNNLNLEDTNLKAKEKIEISSDGVGNIKSSTLMANGNIELFAKDNLTLDGVKSNSQQHTALNSKKNIFINSQAGTGDTVNFISTKTTELNSTGTLSLISEGNQNLQNTKLTGGAILLEAGGALNTPKIIEFNATGSDLLKNDSKLDSLNGDLSIQTKESLTIDPNIHILKAVGDIELASKQGNLTLAGHSGQAGNGSEQVVKLNTSGGSISLEGNKVDIQGAQLTAQKDIKLISSQEDIFIDGIKNKFTNFSSKKYITSLNQNLLDINAKINIVKNDNSYLSIKNKIANLGNEANQISQLLNSALSEYMSGVDPLNASIGYDSESGNFIYVSNYDGGRAYFVSVPPELNLDRYRQIVIDDLPLENKKLNSFNNKINQLEQDKFRINETINFINNNTNGYEHAESNLISKDGNITLTSARGISISGANIAAITGQTNIEARAPLVGQYTSSTINSEQNQPKKISASIIIDGHTDFYDKGKETDANYSMRTFISPTIINGTNGVNIKAIGNTISDNLVLQATGIIASQGDVKIEANKSILFDASVEQSYDRSTSTTTKKSWGGLKKKITTTIEETNITNAASVDISAKNIYVETKKMGDNSDSKKPDNNIDIYSGRFTATNGQISIISGGNLNFYTAEETSSSKVDITKKSSFLSLKYNDSKTNATRTQISELPAILKADYIGTKSGFDTRLIGTEFEYLKGSHIEAGGKIELLAAKTQITDLVKKEKNSVIWQSMQDKGSVTETAKLPRFNGPTPPEFKAAGGLVVQIPIGEKDQNKIEIRDQILALANQPGNDYLNQLVNRNDVDWQKVILAQKDWDYKSQGLTAAGAAIIAIVVAALTYGGGVAAIGSTVQAASGATTVTVGGTTVTVGAGGSATFFGGTLLSTSTAAGVTTYTTTGIMINAAVTSIATQASVGLVNNQGDISKTVKDLGSKDSVKNLAASVVTAGLLSQVGSVLNIKDISGFPTRLLNNFTTAVGSTLVQTAIKGGDLENNLKVALLAGLAGAVQGELANQIGTNLDKVDPNVFEYTIHKIAHAAVGCAVAAATKSSCEAGAIGAGVGEIVASLMPDPANGIEYNEDEKIKIRNTGKIVAGVVSAYAGYDVNTAANSADIAIQNNSLVKLATSTGKILVKTLDEFNALRKTGKQVTKDDLITSFKKQGADELIGIADDLLTVFGRSSSSFDRALAAIDLIVGTDLKPGKGESLKIAKNELEKLKTDRSYVQTVYQNKIDVITRNRLNGKEFETSAASKLGIQRNTDRQMITVKTERDGQINIIPDAFGNGGTLVEFKNLKYITDTKQFRGYAATKKPVTLVINPDTKYSSTIENTIRDSKGIIYTFDQTTQKLKVLKDFRKS
ncbi:two-partner secretion domain-containing protein [Acinetobacter soli]|uniref:two-partner secretion domain-containing protein n=1 Tax=Acinetobacter soli TaxID=487316 RepID=UPI00124F7A2D|nr:DUF637 domain-containing protein [Acinetobacter soli]